MLESIGVIESPFPDRRGCPRQAVLVPAAEATVRFNRRVPGAALEGIGDYSHCWIIFMFSENADAVRSGGGRENDTAAAPTLKHGAAEAWSGGAAARLRRSGRTWPAKVAAPRSGGKVGVFSTRSPHRPNAIGLSVCRVLRADAADRSLTLGGVDFIDGTPVLDVKPYVPYDAVPRGRVPRWVDLRFAPSTERYAPSTVAAMRAWCGGDDDGDDRTVEEADAVAAREMEASVSFSPRADAALRALAEDPAAAREALEDARDARAPLVLRTYAGRPVALRACVAQVVAQDPRSVHHGRGTDMASEPFALTIDGVCVSYVATADGTVVVDADVFSPAPNEPPARKRKPTPPKPPPSPKPPPPRESPPLATSPPRASSRSAKQDQSRTRVDSEEEAPPGSSGGRREVIAEYCRGARRAELRVSPAAAGAGLLAAACFGFVLARR